MQPGFTRANPAYYVAIAVLAVAITAGITLFVMLTTRSSSDAPRFVISGPAAAPCPTGSGAPACYSFDVTNIGGESGKATCIVTPGVNTEALFLNDERSTDLVLIPNETRPVYTKVTPSGGNTIAARPVMVCK